MRSYEDREGQKRNVTEVVVQALRFLGPAKNGNGAKADSSKAADHADESDHRFKQSGHETSGQDVPF